MTTPVNNIKQDKKGFPIEHFKCEICQGYIIDATTLSDCLHPCKHLIFIFRISRNKNKYLIFIFFLLQVCKTCIVTYLETDVTRCPTCDKTIKTPQNCIQPDPKYQRLIYKFLPQLLKGKFFI
jgi:hypothetical protein